MTKKIYAILLFALACFSGFGQVPMIVTLGAPVLMDVDSACLLSVIDIRFQSNGLFGHGGLTNTYTAELSDSTGSFANPIILGSLVWQSAFPGGNGLISGIIPQNVSPGCGYYVRVVANSPITLGNALGPFCIKPCDLLTNGTQDMHVCVNNSVSVAADTNFTVGIHQWDSLAVYDSSCNDWTVELRSLTDFSLVNTGGLGSYHNATGGSFALNMPAYLDQLQTLNIQAGQYYMRVTSNCTNEPWNNKGTVIRLTIGAPDTTALLITVDDSTVCPFGICSLTVSPFNHPPSDYEWASNLINNNQPLIWGFNPLLVSLTTAVPGTFAFYVREINNGCRGAYSGRQNLIIGTTPDITLTGLEQVCTGDTLHCEADFYSFTYYHWPASDSSQSVSENYNTAALVFSDTGAYTIMCTALNDCGSDTAFKTITVTNCDTLTSVSALPNEDLFTIHPVPSSGKLFLTGLDNANTITVFDSKGEQVLRTNAYTNTIDLSGFSSGVYLISVLSRERVINRRVVLER